MASWLPDPADDDADQVLPMDAANNLQLTAADDFVGRLRLLVEKVGTASLLAKRAGISASGFQKYLAGAEPTRKVLIALADAAQVDLLWLMTGQGTMGGTGHGDWPQNHLTLLPLYDLAGAGWSGTPTDDEKLVQLAFCREWLGKYGYDPQHLVTMRVHGRNMEPTLRPGDTLIIDRRAAPLKDGEIYVLREQSSLLVKRIEPQLGGKVRLLNDSDGKSQVVARMEELDIVGQVIWRGALL